jgi:nucleoside-diphosphate-sugar epimerase
MKHVIITGATGFIGANLTRRLLNEGHEIHLLVRPNYSPRRIQGILKDVDLHEIELQDSESLRDVVSRIRPEWVFHLAASGAYSWQTNLENMVQTNVVGTINLIESCIHAGFETFINTGSSSEYGFKSIAPTETEWLEPNSYYAATKASASLFCRYTAQSRNLRLYTLRLYSVYGPFEEPKRLIPTLIRSGLKGKLPPLVNPDTARDYVYVDDVIDAYLLAATRSVQELGAIYNIGSGVQTFMHEVVYVACQVLGIVEEPKWGTMSQRIWDTNTWVANNQKSLAELGWNPKITFQKGFRKTVQWYSDNLEFLDYQ